MAGSDHPIRKIIQHARPDLRSFEVSFIISADGQMTERMNEAEFQQKAENAIGELETRFARLAEVRDIDVQVEGGVLSISFEEGEPGRFIVSPNSSVRQLWVSARVSSFKFDWSEETNEFVLAGSGEPLKRVMTRLTRDQLADEAIDL